jgi:hypothetical protein
MMQNMAHGCNLFVEREAVEMALCRAMQITGLKAGANAMHGVIANLKAGVNEVRVIAKLRAGVIEMHGVIGKLKAGVHGSVASSRTFRVSSGESSLMTRSPASDMFWFARMDTVINTGFQAGGTKRTMDMSRFNGLRSRAIMSIHSYSRCWIHVIWGTLNREKTSK